MSDPEGPEKPEKPEADKKKPAVGANRIILWVMVGGLGLYMIVTGIVGILTKAR